MELAATPKDIVLREGTARLYHFRGAAGRPAEAGPPVLLVPSVINRWYVLDLRPGFSLAEALVAAGHDVYCLDWGMPEDEDRHLEWPEYQRRLGRAVRAVKRRSGHARIGLLGYCMGAILCGIYAAQHAGDIAAFVNLAGPFDFTEAGFLGHMTNPRWFDVEAISAAGNVVPPQMQSGFTAMRPTAQLAKVVNFWDRAAWDTEAREAFEALEAWAGDNIPFPAAAYQTYIGELYQKNLLVKGEHYVNGERVDLGQIKCPVLTIGTDRDTICPLPAAAALNGVVGSTDKELFVITGGHVGAVVGTKAPKVLYPKIAQFFSAKLAKPVSKPARPVAQA
jgi:polyhydroxyalkanoate synthase